eukprot:4938801-Lingulodinium_polyedra.AAC.1
MPSFPVPPYSVADVSRVTTNKSTDLLAVVKQWSRERESKTGEGIVDVDLIDNSEVKTGLLATVTVSVFGHEKIAMIKASVGSPLVFFNLVVSASRDQTKITHYAKEIAVAAPQCCKTTMLEGKQAELTAATNVESITTEFKAHEPRDVSGPQTLSCTAFLDYTAKMPLADMPPVVQLMWIHIEEPEPDDEVCDSTGERIWFRTHVRDASGSVLVGVPQRNALSLASCVNKDEFKQKHVEAELNWPLLCHARVSRTVRESTPGGASQPVAY